MPPNADYVPVSSLGIQPPPRRVGCSGYTWLEDRCQTDGAEGLWRVHDGIYDLTSFIKNHPGGSEWLELSKGTDITEAFEVHHISSYPEEMLKKFFVRKAKTKRNYPFTFKEDGFYRTLKREVAKDLKSAPTKSVKTTNLITDALLAMLFILSILAVKYWNFYIGILAGIFLGLVTIAAHNYIHHKDNFRMYYFNFSLLLVREFRISHALSHHMHTNTIDDMEISFIEPFLLYLPINKSPIKKYGQFLVAPFVWMTAFHRSLIGRMLESNRGKKVFKKTDLVPFLLPLFMWLFGGQSLLAAFAMWNLIVAVGSTHLFFVGLHAGHHHPDVFHDGDAPRSKNDYDWGLSQLDALLERTEITGSSFLVLTNFGDHALHHFFPTLDHGTLKYLYPTLKKVMTKFDANLRMVSQLDTITGSFRQLVKTKPSDSPPDLWKYEKLN